MLKQENKYKIDINSLINPVQINSGNFGSTYLVQDKDSHENYEAKVLNCPKDDSKYKRSIIQEINIIIRVQHPTIIKFHGYSLQDFDGKNNITIVMDYPTNGTLSGAIKNSHHLISNVQYDNTARQIILVGIARGMMHLHRNRLINPCLMPSNILLDKDLHPHITNFSLSNFFERNNTKSQNLIYNAPEVIANNKYNSKSDVYSFGILMYETLTESVPYPLFQTTTKMTVDEFKEKVVSENFRPEFRTPLKNSMKRLIERCWSKDPKKRPSFEELFNKLAFGTEEPMLDLLQFDNEEEEDDENEQKKFFLDGVDTEKLQQYVSTIKDDNLPKKEDVEKLKRSLRAAKKENERLKKQISQNERPDTDRKKITFSFKEEEATIDDFNGLQTKFQQKILNKLSQISMNDSDEDDYSSQCFQNLSKLLLLLQQFNATADTSNLVKLTTRDKRDNDLKLKESPTSAKKIYLFSPTSEFLYSSKSFDFTTFRIQLNAFDEVTIEIKYPSDDFKEVYEMVSNLKSSTRSKIKISIFFCEIRDPDEFLKIKTNINSVRIDPSVTVIKSNAFGGYSILADVMLPPTVTSIEENCFEKCKHLKKIELPPTVKTIGSCCFRDCVSLKEISIPPLVKKIGKCTFKGCLSLETVKLPPLLLTIDDCAFMKCSSLKSIDIPDSVISIGKSAFSECASIESVSIPSSLTQISKCAFEGCNSLSSVEIPTRVQLIDEGGFRGCSSLMKISIPPNVTEIGWNAFSGCTSLKQISIPSSVQEIKYNVLSGCLNLRQIEIDPYQTKITPQAFDSLLSLNRLVITTKANCIQYCYLFKNFAQISINSPATSIGKNAFGDCDLLWKISIPSSVASIGDSAFFGCASLKEIEIPSSVTSIGASAFSGCESLVEITIPQSVSLIGKNAFYGCKNLKQISILSQITSIGDNAFQGCSSLTQIAICSSVNSIGTGAFSGCNPLTQTQMPYSVNSIGKSQNYRMLGIDPKVKIVTI